VKVRARRQKSKLQHGTAVRTNGSLAPDGIIVRRRGHAGCSSSAGRLFHSRCPAAEKAVSPRRVVVRCSTCLDAGRP